MSSDTLFYYEEFLDDDEASFQKINSPKKIGKKNFKNKNKENIRISRKYREREKENYFPDD